MAERSQPDTSPQSIRPPYPTFTTRKLTSSTAPISLGFPTEALLIQPESLHYPCPQPQIDPQVNLHFAGDQNFATSTVTSYLADRRDQKLELSASSGASMGIQPSPKGRKNVDHVLGRLIAANESYICYGLNPENIKIRDRCTGFTNLVLTHTQSVTDMAFFADDVHLLASVSVEGRLCVWKFSQRLDEGGTQQVTAEIVIAIQIVDEEAAVHPRVCWHCHKEEVLVVGVGNRVLRIYTSKVAKGTAEDPIKCPVVELIDGVQLVGEHRKEVTDLSMCRLMTNRLVSASIDGTIKIWDDWESIPLLELRPFDGSPVYSSIILTTPDKPYNNILVTLGPLKRKVKIWFSERAVFFVPPGKESWRCSCYFTFKSPVLNQVIALSQYGVLLFVDAMGKFIYPIHIDFDDGRAYYGKEVTVQEPILSFAWTYVPDMPDVLQLYFVHAKTNTQLYLDLRNYLPLHDATPKPTSEGAAALHSGLVDAATLKDMTTSSIDSTPVASLLEIKDVYASVASQPPSLSPWLSGSGLRSTTDSTDSGDQQVNEHSVDREMNSACSNSHDMDEHDDYSRDEQEFAQDEKPIVHSLTFEHLAIKKGSNTDILTAASSEKITEVDSNGDSDVVKAAFPEINAEHGMDQLKSSLVRLRDQMKAKAEAANAKTDARRALVQEGILKNLKSMVREIAAKKILPVMVDTMLNEKKAAVRPVFVDAITSATENSAICACSKAQFKTWGETVLKDTLKSSMRDLILPAFEKSCEAISGQVKDSIQKGMTDHATAAQQHFEKNYSLLAYSLKEFSRYIPEGVHILRKQVADCHCQLNAIAAGTWSFHDKVEMPLYPTTELQRFTRDNSFNDGYIFALQKTKAKSEPSFVSWLSATANLPHLLLLEPLPLSLGVLLLLLHAFAKDIKSDTLLKLAWMKSVVGAMKQSKESLEGCTRDLKWVKESEENILWEVHEILDDLSKECVVRGIPRVWKDGFGELLSDISSICKKT